MGKKGPCTHCGIESTPLWRNGPPYKPVLCNACGSRWRIRGTLENYIPKHALKSSHASVFSSESFFGVKQETNTPAVGARQRKKKNSKSQKKLIVKTEVVSDDESSSEQHKKPEPALRIPKLESIDVITDIMPDSVAPTMWDTQIPSKKRSKTTRYGLSIVERLHKNLLMILREKRRTSLLQCADQGKLIYYKNDHDAEIGIGCFLLNDSVSSKRK